MNSIFIVIPILIVLMFGLGLSLNLSDFKSLAKKPAALITGLAGQLVVLPALAFVIAEVFSLPALFYIGVILIACCPGGSSSNVFSKIAGGNVALSITLTALSSIITIFTIPLVLQIALNQCSGFEAFASESFYVSDIPNAIAQNSAGFTSEKIHLPVGKLLVALGVPQLAPRVGVAAAVLQVVVDGGPPLLRRVRLGGPAPLVERAPGLEPFPVPGCELDAGWIAQLPYRRRRLEAVLDVELDRSSPLFKGIHAILQTSSFGTDFRYHPQTESQA